MFLGDHGARERAGLPQTENCAGWVDQNCHFAKVANGHRRGHNLGAQLFSLCDIGVDIMRGKIDRPGGGHGRSARHGSGDAGHHVLVNVGIDVAAKLRAGHVIFPTKHGVIKHARLFSVGGHEIGPGGHTCGFCVMMSCHYFLLQMKYNHGVLRVKHPKIATIGVTVTHGEDDR